MAIALRKPRPSKEFKPIEYPAVFHEEEDGGYSIEFPGLKGCFTDGETFEEAYSNAQEALTLFLEDNAERGNLPKPVQVEGDNIVMVTPLPEIVIPVMLKQIRKKSKLTTEQMAQKLKVTPQAYQKMENVRKFNASIRTIERVVKALGRTMSINIW